MTTPSKKNGSKEQVVQAVRSRPLVTAYIIFLGRDEHDTVQVSPDTELVTGITVMAKAAELALANPDVRVSVEFVVS